jgi:hypothetical protein
MTYVPLIWFASTALCFWAIYTHGNPQSFKPKHYALFIALAPLIVVWATYEFTIGELRR